MEHCCANCKHYNSRDIRGTVQDFCEKSGKIIPIYKSEVYCCDDNYEPDYFTAQCEKEEAERAARSVKQRLMLKDLKDYLKDYNSDDYEDNSPDVKSIYEVVEKMVSECDPSRVISTLDWD